MRVGFFGGTFDPPHLGHLAVARAAAGAFRLDRLLLAPTGRQPLKEAPPKAPYADRLAMVALLCDGESPLEPSSVEGPSESSEANYTIDTLRRVRATLNPDDLLFAVTGADAFLDIRRWREPNALLAEAEWIVVSRPGFALDDLGALKLSDRQLARVHLLTDVDVPVSATGLRRKLSAGEDCRQLVPQKVLAYIRAHGLYRSP